ncbi:COBRA-like protein 7 [Chenopodium quinoa]|uniref:COBRA C-terminal domain-containing protein n=1 Tax=Chenopodium quinoa TaxID=63459 RepID=A0A803M9C7_CHEQI|nr:COBRA-like protein 7 [Chenopodium quinoa]
MEKLLTFIFFTILYCLFFLPTSIISQTQNISSLCNGIFLQYTYTRGEQLPPNITASDPTDQPYKFQSTLYIQNNGLQELKSWKAFVGFRHGELLVSASNAVLLDGSPLPANVSNDTVFTGYPTTDLKTAVETAGDLAQMSVRIELVGTEFGVSPEDFPMPSNISLANDGFICASPTMQGNTSMSTCCIRDPNAKSTINATEQFLPRQSGDLSIMYDVISAYESNYWAQVTISNQNQTGRLDNWQLSWEWMRKEFIYSMRGATPYKIDSSKCIFGDQAKFYQSLDLSRALSCEHKQTIIDLPPTLANDQTLGSIPYCCRNGTILPSTMDPSMSISAFQMQVYKMPPDLNVTIFNPPQNWKINGTFNQDYQCGNPIRVSPSLLPSPNGLPVQVEAIASWQVVCNKTRSSTRPPKCCVSFSSFFYDSVIPCKTCACGCPNPRQEQACNDTADAIALPSYALLIPFENRTKITTEYARLNHIPISNNLLPCGDNCGVTINWHLSSDYRKGWTSRVTLFNWGDTNFSDWFVAAELDKAGGGLERVYSFNGSSLPGDSSTIFMHGFPSGNDYLLGQVNGSNPNKDPKRPGTLQSVILFDKKKTPGINVARGDGFPTKVIFNGEECSLPTILPINSASMVSSTNGMYSMLITLVLMFMLH